MSDWTLLASFNNSTTISVSVDTTPYRYIIGCIVPATGGSIIEGQMLPRTLLKSLSGGTRVHYLSGNGKIEILGVYSIADDRVTGSHNTADTQSVYKINVYGIK